MHYGQQYDLINTISRRLVLQLISGETPSDVASVGFSLTHFTNVSCNNNSLFAIYLQIVQNQRLPLEQFVGKSRCNRNFQHNRQLQFHICRHPPDFVTNVTEYFLDRLTMLSE